MQYRRSKTPGGTYFFTLVTFRRSPIFTNEENTSLLRQAFQYVKTRHPFEIDAFVLLPDHLHCVWTLPEGDSDFPTRWNLIKGYFSRNFDNPIHQILDKSRTNKREKTIWQRRFWEHQIKDDDDMIAHINYIHFNPVKHGLVDSPLKWKHSSFRRYVDSGAYRKDWGSSTAPDIPDNVGRE